MRSGLQSGKKFSIVLRISVCGRKSFLAHDVSKPSGSEVQNGAEVITLPLDSVSVVLSLDSVSVVLSYCSAVDFVLKIHFTIFVQFHRICI